MSDDDRKILMTGTFTPADIEAARDALDLIARLPLGISAALRLLRALKEAAPDHGGAIDKIMADLDTVGHVAHGAGSELWRVFAKAELHEAEGPIQ